MTLITCKHAVVRQGKAVLGSSRKSKGWVVSVLREWGGREYLSIAGSL